MNTIFLTQVEGQGDISRVSSLYVDYQENVHKIGTRVDYRINKPNDNTQWIYAPSILLDYLWRKRYHFELETGGEWSSQQLIDSSEDTTSYYVYAGYRADF